MLQHLLEATFSGVVDLVWVNADQRSVLALTEAGRLWRSGDGGASWASETSTLLGASDAALSRLVLNRGAAAVWPQRVYLVGSYAARYNTTLLWSTTNGGVTYNQPCAVSRGEQTCVSWPGGTGTQSLVALLPHPGLADVALAITRSAVCPQSTAACVRQDLWVTRNGGHSWVNASAAGGLAGVVEAMWAPEATMPGSTSVRIFVTAYLSTADRVAGVWFNGYWDKTLHLMSSADLFATPALLAKRCGNAFSILPSGGGMYVGVAGNCDGAASPSGSPDGWAVSLVLTRDSGATWQVSCFPLSEAEHGYTLYGGFNGTGDVYVNVDHTDDRDPVRNNQPLGVVYHADATGRLFSLSRRDVLLQPGGASDLMPVDGIPGALLVNSVDGALFTDPAFLTGARTAYDAVQSKFSSNAGSTWAFLPVPAPLAGDAAQCAGPGAPGGPSCALHVHGPDALYGSDYSYAGAYSTAYAPGVVMSTGSVGDHLAYSPSLVNTFLSWDGAATWAAAAAGPHTYEVAANGGLVVLAPTGAPTNHALFTLDGGQCWQQVHLAQPLLVTNIQTRPDGGGLLLLLHGLLPGQSNQGVIYTLDFSALLRQSDFPACGPSDYEAWTPATCQHGQAAIYSRRKQRARCSPAPASRTASRSCGCDPATDFECSFGYERSDASGQCVPMADFALDPGCPAADPTPTRLIAGDQCSGTAPSPSSPGQPGKRAKKGKGPSPVAIFFIVIFSLAGAAALLALVARLLGLPLPPAVARAVDDVIHGVRSGLAMLRGGSSSTRHTRLDESEWLDNDEATFAPLAGSYVPPRAGA